MTRPYVEDLPRLMEEGAVVAAYLSKAHRTTSKHERTHLLIKAAQYAVRLREKFPDPYDHRNPDWAGRSRAYRRQMTVVYREAGLPEDPHLPVKTALRYHIGEVLRETLDAEALESVGLQPHSQRQRNAHVYRKGQDMSEHAKRILQRFHRHPTATPDPEDIPVARETVRIMQELIEKYYGKVERP